MIENEPNPTAAGNNVTIVIKSKPGGDAPGWPGKNFTLCKKVGSTRENPQTSDRYAYKFSGGNWSSSNGGSAGGFQCEAGKEPVDIEVKIVGSGPQEDALSYTIEEIAVIYDNNSMPANLKPSWDGNSGTIANSCQDVESGYYQVVFSINNDPEAGPLICDPRWQNW
jgi:hypothetical protein